MMMECFRQYVVVGGMPQAVAAFAHERNLDEVEFAKKLILDLYYEDVGKYAGRLKNKVRAIWRAIPGELGRQDKRFSPGAVAQGVRMRELDAPFEWLASAMTVNLAYNVTDPNVGFSLTSDHKGMKCYLADTGLLMSLCFADNPGTRKDALWKVLTGKLEINKGMLMRDYTTASLERYKAKFPGYCAERVVLHPGDADFSGDIIYLPLYMAPLLAAG